MQREDARRLLDRIGVLTHACDLDLLIFFVRHPRSILTSESLAAMLGYGLKEIADSLDVLLAAGLLTRAQTPAHAARLYSFAIADTDGGTDEGPLQSLVRLGSTRDGRLALRRALTRGPESPSARTAPRPAAVDRPGPRRLIATPKRASTA